MKYLLDTNICIYYFKGIHDIDKKIKKVGISNCSISEITVAELKYGIEKSEAKEKVRLRKTGDIIDEFDLLIGSTAIANEMILVTGNKRHFERLEGIILENWVEEKL